MLMEMAPQPFLTKKHASVADAKSAYFEGDFDRCLQICADIRVSTVTTASEVALIAARAYLRTGRPAEAQKAIIESRETHTSVDASLTAEMLLASARIRQDDADTGIAMLETAAARSASAHFAIRSEIAFCTALGYWSKRDIGNAETFLDRVDPRSDIIHARALELRAWCHTVRHDYRRSVEYFRLTLLRLDDCDRNDRAITATAISSLATFAAELFDLDIARFVEARAQSMDWTPALSEHRYVTLESLALFHEFSGNTIKAYELAAQARESATSVPSQTFGWALSSAIARNAGERFSAVFFAQRARQLLRSLDARKLVGEERLILLSVAEACASFDPEAASDLFATYAGLAPLDPMLAALGDPRQAADEALIAGVIAQAQCEFDRARSCYRRAFEAFRDLGYVRRAVMSAHALLTVSGDDGCALLDYISTRLGGTANYITESLTRSADDLFKWIEHHPVFVRLPPAQREVVTLICMGKTNKEIAQLRNVSEQTIKNMLTKNIYPAFGVSNRTALVGMCLREVPTQAVR